MVRKTWLADERRAGRILEFYVAVEVEDVGDAGKEIRAQVSDRKSDFRG